MAELLSAFIQMIRATGRALRRLPSTRAMVTALAVTFLVLGCGDRFDVTDEGPSGAPGGTFATPGRSGGATACCMTGGNEGSGADAGVDDFQAVADRECEGTTSSCLVDWVGKHDEAGFELGEAPRFSGLTGVFVSDGLLYVTHRHALSVVDPETRSATLIAGNEAPGRVDGAGDQARLSDPRGVVVHQGVAYVADTGNRRIVRVDLESSTVESYLTSLTSAPSGLALHFREGGAAFLLVADEALHIVVQIELSAASPSPGVIAGTFGEAGSNTVQLDRPYGLALWQDTLFISERGNHWVRSVDLTRPAPLSLHREWGGSGPGFGTGVGSAALLHEPTGLLADAGGVFVMDAGNRVIRHGTIGASLDVVVGAVGEAGHSPGISDQALMNIPQLGALLGDSIYFAEDTVIRRLGLP